MDRKITKIEAITPLPTLKRTAAYARVSCKKDEMLHSLAAQVCHYSTLIQSRADCIYVGVYADEETGTTDSRAEFKRLLADCRAGLIDEVITKSISRFARNTVVLLETIRELKFLGIGVYFEEQCIYTLSADGELMLSILASYAQEESLSVSENCKWRIRKDYSEGRISNNLRIYGYSYENGILTVIPAEAEVVKMIFADYLSGLGKNAIVKRLIKFDVPTKNGGRWSENTIHSILTNEKMIGDCRLQKGYISDHITKRYKPNKGELPQYYVEGSHEGIVSREVFEAVQVEIKRRAAGHKPKKLPKKPYELTGMIQCGKCGVPYRRKYAAAGSKYEKIVWICPTFNTLGKAECASQQIPEDILRGKIAEVGGLESVAKIIVPEHFKLVFNMKDGQTLETEWQHRSRRESWTDEMKQQARIHALKGGANIG